jgi:hypothetical protein
MHSVVNSYKNVLSVAIETEYSWPEIEELKDRIANPDAYAAAAPAAGGGGGGEAAPAAAAEEEKEEEEDSDDGGFGGLLYVFFYPSLFRILYVRSALLTFSAVTKRCHPFKTTNDF